ncbi:GAF domain-containing protein [candidate division KSB3 bacterium]|uniref:GAF domain-containing protein n=1 Tax=candidate division KSB3 bacterium TaxID=2044937 RepID=A0A9D5Q7L1_9BACT|nr:GAF domain-containing protein [candidate division KSB3 bacterium]MBD3326412.1 GAF domain-containing protein [candidate division KSB3 bacterium]
MLKFNDLTIGTKLMLIFSTIGISAIAIIGYISYTTAQDLIQQEVYQKLIAVRETKKDQIQDFIQEKIRDIEVLARGQDVHILFEKLAQYHRDTNVGPNEPYNVSTSAYQAIYEQYGNILAHYIETYQYQDIYMMCAPHGHVMYTAAKNRDLGTNLQAGPYADSSLAKVWQKVVTTRQVAIQDFEPYAPQDNEPVSFIATPIINQTGQMIGVIALEISGKEINDLMLQRQGLGETGEAYLVGSDHLMRSDSYHDPQTYSVHASFRNPAAGRLETEATRQALQGSTDVQIIKDYRGKQVLSAYTFLDIFGNIRWALLAEIDTAEAFADVYALRNTVVLWGILLIAIVMIAAHLFSKTLVRPLQIAVNAAENIARGNLDVEFDIHTRDEIGQVLEAMNTMSHYIQDVANVAEKIAAQELQGDVTPKSDDDVLNHSFQKMVINLRTMMQEMQTTLAEIEHQNWLKEGLNQLNTALVGQTALKDLSQQAVSFVARYLNAGRGVLYTYDPDHHLLHLTAAFAFTASDQAADTYRLGEGIIGQVAQERAPIFLNNVTRSQQQITTGTTNEAPLNTYTCPLLYNDDLYGVLEIASFEALDPLHQTFLQEAARVIATVIFSTLQQERVQELLRISQHATQQAEQAKNDAQQQAAETQKANAQLEEQQQQLHQQSEEMQQINAHLEKQQQHLQQQSEELRQKNEHLTAAKEALDHRSQELEHSQHEKIEFLKNITADIQPHISSIIQISSTLSQHPDNAWSANAIDHLATIHQAGENLLQLMNQLLKQSHLEEMSVPDHDHPQPSQPPTATPPLVPVSPPSPLLPTDATPDQASNDPADATTILIVDDDMQQVFLLASVLEDHNFATRDALDGQAALEILRQHPNIGAVLIDTTDPERQNCETIRAIRDDQRLHQLPIIAMTTEADRQRCLDAGADDVLSTPVDPETLLQTVNTWLAEVPQTS